MTTRDGGPGAFPLPRAGACRIRPRLAPCAGQPVAVRYANEMAGAGIEPLRAAAAGLRQLGNPPHRNIAAFRCAFHCAFCRRDASIRPGTPAGPGRSRFVTNSCICNTSGRSASDLRCNWGLP